MRHECADVAYISWYITKIVSGYCSICYHYISSVILNVQKQPFRGVLLKRCSENMQQIYRRTPMPQWDFNKVALSLYRNRNSAWVFSCKFAAPFPKNTSEWLTEIGKKNKQKLSNILKLNFCYMKIIPFLQTRYYQKIMGDIVKNAQKTSVPVLLRLCD